MHKRGLEYTLLIRLFFIILIIGLCLTVIVRIQDNTLYSELKILHDVSYLYQASSSSPEKFSLNYVLPKNYRIDFNKEECKIGVKSLIKKELTPLTLNCPQMNNQNIEILTEEKDGIQTIKIQKVA